MQSAGTVGLIVAAAAMPELPDPASPQAIGWLALVLAGLATAANQIHSLWQRTKDKPSGGEVAAEAAQRFSTKLECAQRHADHEHRFAQMESQIAAAREDAINGRRNLHNKVEAAGKETTAAMNELRRELKKDIEEVRRELSEKTDGIPERVITMLKNTGAI